MHENQNLNELLKILSCQLRQGIAHTYPHNSWSKKINKQKLYEEEWELIAKMLLQKNEIAADPNEQNDNYSSFIKREILTV